MKRKLLSLMLVLGLCVGLSGCGGDGAPSEKVFLSEDEITAMYSSPKEYKGKYVEITGKVFADPEVKDGMIVFQMWKDADNSDKNTVVKGTNPEGGIKSGDYVKIIGYVEDEFTGKNAFGGEITAPQIAAETIEKTDYKTAVSPTIKEVLPEGATIEQNGISVSITKIEFAKAETRVYYKIVNNSSNKFSFYSFNTKLTQNGKQFEEESNYNADYQEPSSEILAGITSEGVVAYPALEQANFTIITEGHSDNYREDFTPFTFDITVK